jgi:hypothetical protein
VAAFSTASTVGLTQKFSNSKSSNSMFFGRPPLVVVTTRHPSQQTRSTFTTPVLCIAGSTMTSKLTTGILRRIKAVDALEPTEGAVLIKGWVRTVRKQKTLSFVEVNDGSNMSGIQCVLTLNEIDDETQNGK